jgi:hypothetical protein
MTALCQVRATGDNYPTVTFHEETYRAVTDFGIKSNARTTSMKAG